MSIADLLLMGLRNLFRRKARTILTIIGVVIGTVSIVVMISVGIGVNESFDAMIMQNGSMTVIDVSSNAWEEDESGNYTNVKQKLNQDVLNQLKELDHVKAVTPYIVDYSMQITSGSYSLGGGIAAIDMDCYEEFGYPPLADGTYPNAENASGKFIFGTDVEKTLYDWSGMRMKTKELDPEHDKLELTCMQYENNSPKPFSYKLNPMDFVDMMQTESSFDGMYNIFVDLEFYRGIMQKYANTLKLSDRKKVMNSLENYDSIKLNVDNLNNVKEVQEKLKEMGLRSDSNMQYIQPMKDVANILQMVLGAIGAIAMLVSAINIANTMIMSIYERTREIGIMKVLGCKVSDIRMLFLFEAGMMGLIGGIVGIILSYAASIGINSVGGSFLLDAFGSGVGMSVGEGMAGDAPLSVIPIWLPLFGAGFAMFVGLVSGFFPALKATRISAIEAMKSAE